MIEGVRITPKQIFVGDQGAVKHMLRSDDTGFEGFGEVYFSLINPNCVKAWHLHKKKQVNYAVPAGSVRFVLFDDRFESKTRGSFQKIVIGEDKYSLLTVPKMVWVGFKCVSDSAALIANCATAPFDPDHDIQLKPDDPQIPFSW